MKICPHCQTKMHDNYSRCAGCGEPPPFEIVACMMASDPIGKLAEQLGVSKETLIGLMKVDAKMKPTETVSACNCTGGQCSCDRDRITPPIASNDNCPFCGSTHTGMEGSLHGAYAIMCYVCGAKGPIARKQEIAVKKWNRDV